MGLKERGIVLKQCKISYIYNYFLIVLVAILFVLAWSRFDLAFTLSPQNFEQFWKTFVVLGFVLLMAFLFDEPVIQRWFKYYIITNNEVILTEGIFRKNRIIIPYQSISNVDVHKGIVGRIFNFGNISVVGFRNHILMTGIREPEVFYRIMNNKISVMRGTKQVMARKKIKKRKKKVKRAKGWREDERALRKEFVRREKKGKAKGKTEKKRRRFSLRRRKKQEKEKE